MRRVAVSGMAKLSAKQQAFIDEYLIDLNGTQAAIRAGYSSHTAHEQGAQLLARLSIRAHVDAALAERSRRTGINADRVIRELARIALANPLDVINTVTGEVLPDADRNDTAAIQSVKVKTTPTKNGDIQEREIRIADKTKALELLGKHLGMFVDKHEIKQDVTYEIKKPDFGSAGDRGGGGDSLKDDPAKDEPDQR